MFFHITSIAYQLWRIPTPIALAVSILFAFLFARIVLLTPPSTTFWRSGPGHIPAKSHQQSGQPIQLPTLDQRRRVLDLLTTLSPRYTKECTRQVQPQYATQALERYAPLIGHNSASRDSWLSGIFGSDLDADRVHRRYVVPSEHKYYFAIYLHNSFDVIPDLFATLFRTAAILGYHNVFVSICEIGSSDQTKPLLRIFDALTRSVGMRIIVRTLIQARRSFNDRIEFLAEFRNSAFVPLHELRDSEGEYFDTIIVMNDVLPCVDDILELIWQSRVNNAGITCAADYMYHEEISSPVFYDNWVARDINGTPLENAPFEKIFHDEGSSDRFQRHLPIQVQSCWNGIAVFDPAPFYSPPHVRFRVAKITGGECSASECNLICNDYWAAGYGRIMMVPRVKLAYGSRVFDSIHPERRNLTAIRGYKRFGGLSNDPYTDPQDRSWFGPHDRLFSPEEAEPLQFKPGPEHVWCWDWDGAGDLEGPDVDPIWERMPNKSTMASSVVVKHDRGMALS